ncbi:MAG: cytochrome biosis protein [Xanthobacteraceae bacterium]|nr:cytochrome biosis protein [Xanthobacteraceae bacterium]
MNRCRGVALGLILLAVGAGAALAVQPDEVLKDPTLESRARVLSKELRCMVCQNQSIDDSDAPLARDLRLLVRERLTAGDSNNQVMDFLVARYGAFVLLKPPFNWHTVGLWLLSPVVLIVGGLALFVMNRRRVTGSSASAVSADGLTADEQARVSKLLQP